MNCECYAKITDPERAERIKSVFPDKIPLRSVLKFSDKEGNQYIVADTSSLTSDQIDYLASVVSRTDDEITKEEIKATIREKGCPIIFKDVFVSICSRCIAHLMSGILLDYELDFDDEYDDYDDYDEYEPGDEPDYDS